MKTIAHDQLYYQLYFFVTMYTYNKDKKFFEDLSIGL